MMIKFYDTSALLEKEEFLENEQIAISSITLQELEEIKNSDKPSPEVKYQARRLLRMMDENLDQFRIEQFTFLTPKIDIGVDNNDTKILRTAVQLSRHSNDDLYFITNDLSQKLIAKTCFRADQILSEEPKEDKYCGYLKVYVNDEELADFYSHLDVNKYNLLVNQYLLLYYKGSCVDQYIWTGTTHEAVKFNAFNSTYFGNVKPKAGDTSQLIAFDALRRNKLTLLRGPAGSGKSWISLAYLASMLEREKISKIVIFCNPVASRDSAKLGYYPGDKNDKLLDSQIGNFLVSKFGGKEAVTQLIEQEKLMLLPFSDIRGFDTTGMNCAVYITEGQNLNINLMKLALQRIGEDSICVVEGDMDAQVDLDAYEGNKNGMRRLSQVFRGQPFYGEVTLDTIHRSRIGKIADLM